MNGTDQIVTHNYQLGRHGLSEGPVVLRHRVVLLLPFHVRDDPERFSLEQKRSAWAQRMSTRCLPAHRSDGLVGDLVWSPIKRTDAPREVDELSAVFQNALLPSIDESDAGGPFAFSLNKNLIARYQEVSLVYGGAKLEINAVLKKVECFLLGQDSGVLAISFELVNSKSLVDISRFVFYAKHLNKEGRAKGWLFGHATAGTPSSAYLEAFGPTLRSGFRSHCSLPTECAPVSLAAFANWLLLLDGEKPENLDPMEFLRCQQELPPECKIIPSRYARIHSAVVFERELGKDRTPRVLWRLCRGYSNSYQYPGPETDGNVVLMPRSNRVIGLAREGSACISWLEEGVNRTFEVEQWVPKFCGIYLWIHVYLLTESFGLDCSSRDIAHFSAQLNRKARGGTRNQEVEEVRNAVDSVLRRTISKVLQLSTPDCGGISDYQAFYSGGRGAHSLGARLNEIRRQLSELSGLVEAEFLGIQCEQRDRWGLAFNLGSALLIPFVILQSLAALFPYWFAEDGGLCFEARLAWLFSSTAITTVVLLRFYPRKVKR